MAIQSSTTLSASILDDEDEGDGIAAIQEEEIEREEAEEPGEPQPKKPGTLLKRLKDQIGEINLARDLSEDVLNEIGQAVVSEFNLDWNSTADWRDKADKAMKFATQDAEQKSYPWQGSSNIIFPLITQAAIEFGSRTYPAIIQNKAVVKGCVWGADTGTPVMRDGMARVGAPGPDGQPQPLWLVAPGEKKERADRIGEHMSWQLLDEMPEWEPQTDQLLHQIPIIGGAVRKTYRDPVAGRNFSLFVSLKNIVWDYAAASFEAAPRHSELVSLYPHEITENERTDATDTEDGLFLPLDYGPGGGDVVEGDEDDGHHDSSDPDAPHLFIEQHRRWDLDGDGYPEPYVITVHKRSAKVVRIVARYDADGITASKSGKIIIKIDPTDHYTLIPFLPNVDGGSYPMGFGHLLRPLNDAINSTLNQMFDAGHLQNAGGGFIGDGLGVASGPINFQVGKYVRVTTRGQTIRDSVFPLPFNGPSPVLFQLLGTLISAGKEVASIQNILTGDAAIANAPPTTVLALIEQGVKVYTAIQKRIYRALKSEFTKLYRLNRLYLTATTRYKIGDEWREVTPEDYRLGGGVEPIADPTMVTDMQRLGRSQVVMSLVNPESGIDPKKAARRVLEAAGIDRIDDLMLPPDPQAEAAKQAAVALAMAKAQAELGRTRAAEQKDQTQAFLNLSLAHKNANAQDQAFIEAQLDFLRLHIEALNTSVKAAAVDHKFHESHQQNMRQVQANAAKLASQGTDNDGAPTPGPTGAFPVPPEATAGVGGAGVSPVDQSTDNAGLPPISGGPGGLPPGGGGGPGGIGGAGL